MADNAFANCNTQNEINDRMEALTSPENLWRDGEASRAEVEATSSRLRSEALARTLEIAFKRI